MKHQPDVPPGLNRLNEYIDDVVQQPGWTYKRFAAEANIDVVTLNAVRKGLNKPTDRTARGIDRVLGFQEGKGIQYVLAGRTPVTDGVGSVIKDETDRAVQRIRDMEYLPEEQKQFFINQLLATRATTLEQAERLNQERSGKSA